jgi:pilus assembly protein CpaB
MGGRVVAILVAVALALAATVALVAYAGSADRRAMRAQQPVLVYVARARIAAGTSGEDAQNRGLIERVALPRRAVVAGAVSSLEQLGGRVAAVDILPGEQLLAARWAGRGEAAGRRLLPIPNGHQAVSISLDPTRQVSGFVTPGDRVSVLVSLSLPRGDRAQRTTRFLLQDVQVLAVGATAQANPAAQGGGRLGQGQTQGRGQSLSTVTLAVAPREVERVVFAAENGSLYLSLLPPGQRPVPSRARTIDNEF